MEYTKILVIDDNNTSLETFINCFQGDYRILYAPNGEIGYNIALKELPNLIIMDWAMPVMNGIDTTLKLKATKATKNIPVVMATGVMTDTKDLKQALEAGAIDYVRKPFDPLELTSRVNAALIINKSFNEISKQKNEIEKLFEKEKILMQQQLDHKERELSTQALQSQEKIQLLQEIREGLKKLKKEANLANSDTFKQLFRNTKEALENGKNSHDFLFHFENVHPNFFEKLKKLAYPDMTSNELKIAAYIKIGMNNKEIAQMSGIEVGTVKSNINRLKKKLNLGPKDNIRKFINNEMNPISA